MPGLVYRAIPVRVRTGQIDQNIGINTGSGRLSVIVEVNVTFELNNPIVVLIDTNNSVTASCQDIGTGGIEIALDRQFAFRQGTDCNNRVFVGQLSGVIHLHRGIFSINDEMRSFGVPVGRRVLRQNAIDSGIRNKFCFGSYVNVQILRLDVHHTSVNRNESDGIRPFCV